MKRIAILLLILSTGCAGARKPAEAGVAQVQPQQPVKEKVVEFERILSTFSVKTELPIYLNPQLLERAYSDDYGAEWTMRQIVEAFQNLRHLRGEAAARLNYGAVLWQSGKGDEAYAELTTAQRQFAQAGDLDGEAHAHEWIGYFFRETGEKELAEDHLALAFQMFEKLENREASARVLDYGE